jgi:hypothetical protein
LCLIKLSLWFIFCPVKATRTHKYLLDDVWGRVIILFKFEIPLKFELLLLQEVDNKSRNFFFLKSGLDGSKRAPLTLIVFCAVVVVVVVVAVVVVAVSYLIIDWAHFEMQTDSLGSFCFVKCLYIE